MRDRTAPEMGASFVESSMPGCHVAMEESDWIIGSSKWEADESNEYEIPDLCIDPATKILSVINIHEELSMSAYMSLGETVLASDRRGKMLEPGRQVDELGKQSQVTTIIATVRPTTELEICTLHISDLQACGEEALDISSDVQFIYQHPCSQEWLPERAYQFPLGSEGPFLCSQSEGGALSHFFPQTFHAIDLECPIGE